LKYGLAPSISIFKGGNNFNKTILEMKSAFAKLMEKDPVQSSHIDFRSGGNGIPILTRASGQSTAGVQTMGLPNGSRPYPGGGANKTVLGAIRMGDQDGNAPGSAIIADDIFYPPGQPDPYVPERYFSNVGNNVVQPDDKGRATIALLSSLGDQKFKAKSKAPFEDYLVEQRFIKDLNEASKNASDIDLNLSRDILRKVAEDRRQLNEEDYLRKMLNAGMTAEYAQQEIQNVRNANALQEAKTVDDRTYQAKTLIQRMAIQRGVVPMVREPLNQSSAITNPKRSQAMSEAMGMPGQGFGTSPLDINRSNMTADFYKQYLRRSEQSQEAMDQQSAFNTRLAEGKISAPSSGSLSLATLKGELRQQEIETASEALASRLETLRQHSNRIKLPLPNTAVGKKILDALYNSKKKSEGDEVLYSPEMISDLNPLQLLLSINWNVQKEPNGFTNLMREVKRYTWGTPEKPSTTWINDLRKVAYTLNKNEQTIRVPFASVASTASSAEYINLMNDIKMGGIPELRQDIESGRMVLKTNLNSANPSLNTFEDLVKPMNDNAEVDSVTEAERAMADLADEDPTAQRRIRLIRRRVLPVEPKPIEPKPIQPERLDPTGTFMLNRENLVIRTLPQLRDIASSMGLNRSGNKAQLIQRIITGKN